MLQIILAILGLTLDTLDTPKVKIVEKSETQSAKQCFFFPVMKEF